MRENQRSNRKSDERTPPGTDVELFEYNNSLAKKINPDPPGAK